jgi:hypothetical protein
MASSAGRAPETAAPSHGRAEPETHLFPDDGVFPNSRLPVLIYRGVLATPDAAAFEQMFEANGWSSAWRNGLYSVHHYHGTAHEVLGIYDGRVTARLGGGRGTSVTLVAGDVVVIPAGVAPQERRRELRLPRRRRVPGRHVARHAVRKPGERPGTDRNIARVGMPTG